MFIQCFGLKACVRAVFHEKACQTWEVMSIKLTISPVCLIIFVRSSNNPCSSCVGAGSSKPLTAPLALNFKSKTILGYINPSNRVGDENLQVKELKSYTHWDFFLNPHREFSLIYSQQECVVLWLLAHSLNTQIRMYIKSHRRQRHWDTNSPD